MKNSKIEGQEILVDLDPEIYGIDKTFYSAGKYKITILKEYKDSFWNKVKRFFGKHVPKTMIAKVEIHDITWDMIKIKNPVPFFKMSEIDKPYMLNGDTHRYQVPQPNKD